MTASDTIREIAAGAEDAAREAGRGSKQAVDIVHAIVTAACKRTDMTTVTGRAQALFSLCAAVVVMIEATFDTPEQRCVATETTIGQIVTGACRLARARR